MGLGILVGLVGVLLKNSVPNDVVGVIIVFYLATLFGICFSLIRLMSKLINANVGKKTDKIGMSQTPQFAQPPTPPLNEYYQPVRSVTENTTRNFEKIESKIYSVFRLKKAEACVSVTAQASAFFMVA